MAEPPAPIPARAPPIGGGPTRVALVGTGSIAETHVEVLRSLRDVDLVGVCDVDLARAQAFAQRHAIARASSSVRDLVATAAPRIAHVLVPPPLHAAVGGELLELGVGVLIEKPLATSVADARALVELAERRGLPLGVNHNQTFHPGFVALKRAVAAGELGRIDHVVVGLSVGLRQLARREFGHFMFRAPQNLLFEQASHPFSQVVELLGRCRTASAVRSGRRELAPGLEFFDTWQIALQCERGTATLLLSFGREFGESFLEAIGQDGSYDLDLLRGHATRAWKTATPDFLEQWTIARRNARELRRSGWRNAAGYLLSTLKLKERSDLFYAGMRDRIAVFHASLRGGPADPCDGRAGLAVVECCELAAAPFAATTAATASAPAPAARAAPLRAAANGPAPDVAVTGAAGFIGGHLVERLLAGGKRVAALVRAPAFAPDPLRKSGVTLHAGDVADRAAVAQAITGARVVVHLATGATGGGNGSDDEVARGLLSAAQNVAHACVEKRVKRLVFASTIAVYDLGHERDGIVSEASPLDPEPAGRSGYARGKIEAERWLDEFARESGLELVVVRPGFVVGRRGPPQHSGVGLWVKDTQVFGWGAGERPLPFVLVDDVADALAACCERREAAGRSFNLVGDVSLSAREWVEELRRALGRDFVFHPQSTARWWLEELVKYFVKVAIGRRDARCTRWRDLASRGAARPFDNARAKLDLGWKPVSDRAAFLKAALPLP
jgi:nucleoside-diphosphate-sugar epimerase/predicted dehydrogenase